MELYAVNRIVELPRKAMVLLNLLKIRNQRRFKKKKKKLHASFLPECLVTPPLLLA